MSAQVERSVQHATIVLERVVEAPAPRAYAAWIHPEGWDAPCELHEPRVGGRKLQTFSPTGEQKFREEGRYEDLVPDQRVVYAYSIFRDDVRITVSLQTLEFSPQGARTRLLLTEQLTVLDGGDRAAARERGNAEWLDRFAAALKRS